MGKPILSVISTAFLIMLVTLIVRFIHFAGLSPGKTTSRTISRTPARFSRNQAYTCYRARFRLSHSHQWVSETVLCYRRNWRSLPKSCHKPSREIQSRPAHPENSGHAGRLIYSKLGWIVGATPLVRYSHSMVPGGLEVTSSTTRFTSLTSFVIRFEIFASRS